MTRRIAVIPARGGSKRLPDKNIREFCGKPMIAHILEAARNSGLFDVIHVSTDSESILAVVDRLGFRPEFTRPPELATDTTPIVPVVRHAVREYSRRGLEFDVACLLYACAPLVEASDLQAASRMFEALGNRRTVLSVTPFPVPIEWAYDLDSSCRMIPAQPGMFQKRSQDLNVRVHDTGSFAFFPIDRVLDEKRDGEDEFYGYTMPRHKAVDIDDIDDWNFAEILFRGQRAAR